MTVEFTTRTLKRWTGPRPKANERTRYEVIATNGHRTLLVGYANTLHNDQGMRRFLLDRISSGHSRFELLVERLNPGGQSEWLPGKRAADGYTGPNGWRIIWTGRTERDCATEGEHLESIYG